MTGGWWVAAIGGVVGYGLGSLSPATVVARRAGLDLRAVGSGNPGATNVARALGRRVGAVVAVLDVLKGAVPAVGFGALDPLAGLAAGLGAVLGHVTSPLLRGRGGRGVATAFGAIVGSHPLWAPFVLVAWLVALGVVRVVALASMCAAIALVVVAAVAGAGAATLGWAVGLAVVVVARHAPNVRRWWAARHTAG